MASIVRAYPLIAFIHAVSQLKPVLYGGFWGGDFSVSFAEPDSISRSSGLALVPTSAGNDTSLDSRLCKVGHPKLVFQPMEQRAVKVGPQRGHQ